MNIFLVRHGETSANLEESAKPKLTDKGRLQIIELSKKLSEVKLDLIYCSDLERAIETAKAISVYQKGVEFVKTEDLREIYRLIVGGDEKLNTRPNRFDEDYNRPKKFWNNIKLLEADNVCFVCHGNIIKFFLSESLEVNPKVFRKVDINTASISLVRFIDKEFVVSYINNYSYLPKKLISKDTSYAED
ncbi:MAG: histidine phosphatase family protein [Candidatus Woesearchaeota archaeon]